MLKRLKKQRWIVDRQKGSHMMLVETDYPYILSIPQQRELGIGILRKLIKQAGLNVDKFSAL